MFHNNPFLIHLQNKRLYLATDEAVVDFPVVQCSLYSMCTDCVQDPHCGWDDWSKTCKQYRQGYRRYVETQSPLAACDGQCSSEYAHTMSHLIQCDVIKMMSLLCF